MKHTPLSGYVYFLHTITHDYGTQSHYTLTLHTHTTHSHYTLTLHTAHTIHTLHHCYAEPTDSSPWDSSTSVVAAIEVVSYLSDCSTLIFGLI